MLKKVQQENAIKNNYWSTKPFLGCILGTVRKGNLQCKPLLVDMLEQMDTKDNLMLVDMYYNCPIDGTM
jgi:hypothetical protein